MKINDIENLLNFIFVSLKVAVLIIFLLSLILTTSPIQSAILTTIGAIISYIIIKYVIRYQNSFENKKYIFLIFFIGLLLRIIWVTMSKNIQVSDFHLYLEFSKEIYSGNYTNLFNRHPGAPLFFAFIQSIFGLNSISILIILAFISSLQILIIYSIGKIYFLKSKKNHIEVRNITMLIAPALYAFWPESIIFTNLTGSDILFSFFILLAFYFTVLLINKDSYYYLLLSGIIIGIAHWFRPLSYIYFISFLFYIFISGGMKRIRRSIKYALFISVVYFIILIPFGINSFKKTGTFNPLISSPYKGWILMIGTNLEKNGKYNKDDLALLDSLETHNIKQLFNNSKRPYLPTSSITEYSPPSASRDSIARQIAIDRIMKNPFKIIANGLTFKQKILWADPAPIFWSMQGFLQDEEGNVLNPQNNIFYRIISWFSAIYHRSMLILVLVAIFFILKVNRNVLPRKLDTLVTTLLFKIILISGLHILVEVQPRYHHAFLPTFSIIIASAFFIFFLQKIKN